VILSELTFGIPHRHDNNLFLGRVNTVDHGEVLDEKLAIAFIGIRTVFSWGAPLGQFLQTEDCFF